MQKTVKYGLMAGAALLLVIVLVTVFFTVFFSKPAALPVPAIVDDQTVPVITGVPVTVSRELSGTVVLVDAEAGYMRVAVPGEGIYSVALPADATTAAVIMPMTEVSLTVTEDAPTGQFDYVLNEFSG